MHDATFVNMLHMASEPEFLESTVAYVEQNLRKFVNRHERVLICFPMEEPASIGGIMAQAVRRLGGFPVGWGPDFRWKALLRQAFAGRASVIVGPPLLVLGLTKLARHTKTPLFIRNVVTAGYPCMDWMIDGIIRGLDCRTWGCFGPGTGPVVSGFSCGKSRGVHIRTEEYGIEVLDENGASLPENQPGEIVLYSQRNRGLRFDTMEKGKLCFDKCPCGCDSPRLLDLEQGAYADRELLELSAYLHSWTSVLDCSVRMGHYGLEIEMVVFPGEKLPKLPSCARLHIIKWNPEKDSPFPPADEWKNSGVYADYY